MIVAECRGQTVTVEGLGFKDYLRVVLWPNGIRTREHENELENERVVGDDDADDE